MSPSQASVVSKVSASISNFKSINIATKTKNGVMSPHSFSESKTDRSKSQALEAMSKGSRRTNLLINRSIVDNTGIEPVEEDQNDLNASPDIKRKKKAVSKEADEERREAGAGDLLQTKLMDEQ